MAFDPRDLKQNGKFHRLKVTLAEKHTGYSVQARRGYFAPGNEAGAGAKEAEASSTADQGQEQIREALLSKTEIAQFPVVLDAEVSEHPGDTRELSLLSHVDPKSLHLRKESDHNLDTLTFVFGVFDEKGNLVIAQQRHATVDVADAQLPEFLETGISVDMTFQLKPGSYRIREVVTDSEQRETALSRNVDIPLIMPGTPAAAATQPPAQAPAPQPGGQAVPLRHMLAIANTPITRPDTASGAAVSFQSGNRRASPPRVGQLYRIPILPTNVFADETCRFQRNHREERCPRQRNGFRHRFTLDSIFRLKRVSSDGKTADLVESREIKYVNGHAAAKNQSLTGPAILIGAFSRAPNVLSPQLKDCYDYRLLPNKRHKPK